MSLFEEMVTCNCQSNDCKAADAPTEILARTKMNNIPDGFIRSSEESHSVVKGQHLHPDFEKFLFRSKHYTLIA